MVNISKLQLKSEILSFISNLPIQEAIEKIKHYENKTQVLDILIKELLLCEDTKFIIISSILNSIFEKEKLEEYMWILLQNPLTNDEKKSKILQFLSLIDKPVEYDKYLGFLSDPATLVDRHTKKLLNSALSNPEAKIEFIDFYCSLNKKERFLLLESLTSDFKGDLIVNLIEPLIYIEKDCDILLFLIDFFGSCRSSYAYSALEFIYKYKNNETLKIKAKIATKELQFSKTQKLSEKELYSNFANQFNLEKSLISIPDGLGNIAIILSGTLINSKNKIIFALVANDTSGIISGFGFYNILEEDYNKIIKKFTLSTKKYICHNEFIKLLLDYYKKINYKSDKPLPYEYICFEHMLAFVNLPDENLDNLLDNTYKNKIKINDGIFQNIINNNNLDSWFIDGNISESFKSCVFEIYEKKDILNYKDKLDNIFNKDLREKIKTRLKLTSYILNKNNQNSKDLFSLSFDDQYINKFIDYLMRKSIYQYFVKLRNLLQVDKFEHMNIFLKRNKKNLLDIYDIKNVNYILSQIEKNW